MKAILSAIQSRRQSRASGDGGVVAEAGADRPTTPGTPAAAMTPPLVNLSRSVSPGPPGPVGSPGKRMVKLAVPPPGARMMKVPPPGMNFPPQGLSGSAPAPAASPTRSGGASPTQAGRLLAGPPQAGAKGMHGGPQPQIPPGVKVMAGPPPVGAKVMAGPPPPGVRSAAATPVHPPPPGAKGMPGGPPPAGAKVMASPPPGAKIMHGGPPPGVKIISGPPPGAKIMHGAPPPGARVMKMPLSRPITPESLAGPPKSPIFQFATTSRPMSPEHAQAAGKGMPSPPSAAAMKKIMSGAPPPGARVIKMPAGRSPPGVGAGPNAAILSTQEQSLSTPQLVPQNASFAHPAAQTPLKSQILRPLPVRSAGPAVPGQPPSSASAWLPPADAAGEASDNFEFDEEPNDAIEATPASRDNRDASIKFHRVSSSASSAVFQEDGDVTTALPPPPPAPRGKSPSGNSVQSSTLAAKKESTAARPLVVGPSSAGNGEDAAGNGEGRQRRRRKHRHHTSKSSRRHRSRRDASTESSESSEPSAEDRKRSSGGASHSRGAPPETEREERRQKRRHRSRSDRRNGAAVSGGSSDAADARPTSGGGDRRGSYAPQFPESALRTSTLTPTLRGRIAEQFLSILCPQQYYGKVKKINGIRPLNADRAQATGLRRHNCIYVATKGVMPNHLFYPQLRLFEEDGKPTVDERDRGALDTPIILYEAAPGTMLFAETELDAGRLLETNSSANSCFILASSSILFRDPEHYVLPLAMLNVRWVPYASPQSEPQCPVHRTELQLFDPYTKELVCALCASKDSAHLSKLVVIPDVLKGDSRRKIHESVTRQLDDAQHSVKVWVGQHQRIHHVFANKKAAVRQQFDLLVAAVEAKRQEYLEACEAEYAVAQADVAREILLCDERVQLLTAAADHLRTDATRSLYSMQIATIAEGLEASKHIPSTLSKRVLSTANVSSTTMLNLESVMTELQMLCPDAEAAPRFDHAAARSGGGHGPSRSPLQTRSRGRPGDEVVLDHGAAAGTSAVIARSRSGTPQRRRRAAARAMSASAASAVFHRSPARGERETDEARGGGVPQRRPHSVGSRGSPGHPGAIAGRSPPRRAPPSPSQRQSRGPPMGVSDTSRADHRADAVTVPNSTGTSLFDYPLDELLREDMDAAGVVGSAQKLRKPRVVQWAICVEDPGDWVGIGVGVGTHIDVWERGRSNDLSHLWIVPGGPGSAAGDRHVYHLRVTVSPTVGHARLSIHDARGRQLDDGGIPQWNASRVCYPQVTFGGRIGRVRMIESPHLIL